MSENYFRGPAPGFRTKRPHNIISDHDQLNLLVYEIVPFCCTEVERQGDGPAFVQGMVRAWALCARAAEWEQGPSLFFVQELNAAIRMVNTANFRQVPVTFTNTISSAPSHHDVPRLMAQLWENMDDITVEEFCYEFLRIHPFVDGNGRCAVLLYNLLNGTIHKPVPMPEFHVLANRRES